MSADGHDPKSEPQQRSTTDQPAATESRELTPEERERYELARQIFQDWKPPTFWQVVGSVVTLPFMLIGAAFRYRSIPGITFIVCMALYVVVLGLNGWSEPGPAWGMGSRLFAVALLIVPIVTWAATTSRNQKREYTKWVDQAEKWDPALTRPDPKAPDPGRPLASFAYVIAGAVPGMILAWFITQDPRLGPTIGIAAVFWLPMIGAGLGFYFSPQMRANRYHDAKVAEVHRKQEQALEETYQEWVRKHPLDARTMWRNRAIEALTWWHVQGEKLYSDAKYLVAMVTDPYQMRQAQDLSQQSMARYRSDRDPCATSDRITQLADWTIKNLPTEIEANIIMPHPKTGASLRTAAGVAEIFNLHRRHPLTLQREANAVAIEQAVRKWEATTPEGFALFIERLFKELGVVAAVQIRGQKLIEDIVSKSENPTADRERLTDALNAAVFQFTMLLRNRDANAVG